MTYRMHPTILFLIFIAVSSAVSANHQNLQTNATYNRPCTSHLNCDWTNDQYCDVKWSVCRCLPGLAYDRVAEECRTTRCSWGYYDYATNQYVTGNCPPGSQCINSMCITHCAVENDSILCRERAPDTRYDHYYETVYFSVMIFLVIFFVTVLLTWLCKRVRCKRVSHKDGKLVLLDESKGVLSDSGKFQPTNVYSLFFYYPLTTTTTPYMQTAAQPAPVVVLPPEEVILNDTTNVSSLEHGH